MQHVFLCESFPCCFRVYKGRARTQSPTNKNYVPESPTFGEIAEVSPTGVQWKGLALGEPPTGSRYPLHQVSMLVLTVGTPEVLYGSWWIMV